MPDEPVFIFGDWVYPEPEPVNVDCNNLQDRDDLNEYEKHILKACNLVFARKKGFN